MTVAADGVEARYAHLSAEHVALLQSTQRLAAGDLAPIAEKGAERRVNRPLVAALAQHGLLARLFRRGEDGAFADTSAMELSLIREGLARGSTEAETAFALQGLGAYPILQAGSPELIEAWIPRVAAGEAVAAFALTEPEAGSDVASMDLRAERDGDGFRLTGTKIFISNAPDADVYTVFARTTEGAGARGISAFAVPAESPGLSGERIRMVAPHPIGRLDFDGVPVGPEQLLGDVDRGFAVAMRTLELFRPSVGAFAVGMAQAALDIAVDYAARREAFGKPISGFQAVSHRLAEMATRTQAARLLVHSAAGAYDAGVRPVTEAVAMAKLFATENAQWVVDGAIQIVGARALEEGHLLEHLYREVRAPRIYEGTSEIQREIIARQLQRSLIG
ncbi:MAG: acyl-CoA dehydrogenase family protein [Thermoleophilaceae bacterium]